jgi:Bifunctional DNA primase/polymerase, N-terminal
VLPPGPAGRAALPGVRAGRHRCACGLLRRLRQRPGLPQAGRQLGGGGVMAARARIGEPARLDAGDLLAALGGLDGAQAAQAYAALGYPVVPMHAARPDGGCTCPAGPACREAGKHPRLVGWPRLAATDPNTVAGWWWRWPDANPGLATGRRFDVLDLDHTEGVEALRAALQIAPWEHPGPVARSGSGGWHLLYAPTGLGNRVGLLAGVDWRGRGGLIVAPPSRHVSGGRYAWVRPLTAALPEAPDWLRRLLAPPPATRTTLPPAPLGGGRGRAERYARAALVREAARVRAAPPGTCNDTLNRAAFNLGQLVAAGLLDAGEVRAVLLAAALAAPATGHADRQRKAQATITSGLKGGAAKPRRRRGGAA